MYSHEIPNFSKQVKCGTSHTVFNFDKCASICASDWKNISFYALHKNFTIELETFGYTEKIRERANDLFQATY